MAEKNLYIYDRDDKFVKALQLYFRGSDFTSTVIDSVDALLQRARERRPNVVLLAVETNDDGKDNLRKISTHAATSGVPIVVMSTVKDEESLFPDGVRSGGGTAYIKKPFIKKAILGLLEEVMAGTTASTPAPGKKAGVNLGEVFTDLDQAVDDFFDPNAAPAAKAETGEFTLSFDEEAPAAAADAPIEIALDDDAGGGTVMMDQAPFPPEPSAGGAAAVETASEFEASSPGDDAPTASASGEVKRLRARVRELETELKKKSDEYKAAARDKQKIEAEVGKREAELNDRIRLLEKQFEETDEELKKKKQLVAQMTASVSQLDGDLEEKARKHQSEIGEWQSQLAKLQDEHNALRDRSGQQANEIEDKTEEIARQGRRLEDLEAERNELQTNLETMTQNRDQLDQALATERARIAAAKDRFTSGVATLREALESQMAQARATLERGVAEASEAVATGTRTAQETLEQGTRDLLGQ